MRKAIVPDSHDQRAPPRQFNSRQPSRIKPCPIFPKCSIVAALLCDYSPEPRGRLGSGGGWHTIINKIRSGSVLLFAAIAYCILQQCILRREGQSSILARAIGRDLEGKLSQVAYASGIAAIYWQPWVSAAPYLAVAIIWLIPDSRIERELSKQEPA